MPGVVPKVIRNLKDKLAIKIIAGALIDDKKEIEVAFESGAIAISTGKSEFWNINS